MTWTSKILFIAAFLLLCVQMTFLIVQNGGIFQVASSLVTQQLENDARFLYNAETENNSFDSNKKTTLIFVGDIMFDRGVRQTVERHGGEYQFLFENITLPSADIIFGNLEGPAAFTGKNVGSKYSFRMDPNGLLTLAKNGFSVLSIANNHIGDWGHEAAEETVINTRAVGIATTGWGYASTTDALVMIEKNGIRFGFLAFSEFPSGGSATASRRGVLLATAPYYEEMIREAAKKVDVLIVSLHAGTEYAPVQNRFQENISRKAIDNGARLVIGHHPHVVEPVEEYNGGLIVYSLGNFIFDQFFSEKTLEGGMLEVSFTQGKNSFSYRMGKSMQNASFALERLLWEPRSRIINF